MCFILLAILSLASAKSPCPIFLMMLVAKPFICSKSLKIAFMPLHFGKS